MPARPSTKPSPAASPARRAALALLEAVLDRRRPLEEALDALPGGLAPRDRSAAHRIAATVLRRLGSLDAVLEPFLRRAPPEPVRHALRAGAAELLLLGTPPHAAVGSAVAVVPRPFAGLVNAVLRRVAEAGPAALEGLDAERLDTPAWLWSSWHAAHGPAAVRAIAAAHRNEAPLDLTLAPGAAPPEGGDVLPTGTLRFPAGTRVTELPGFAEGGFWVQDAAAALPARLLGARPGEAVADLCAAPGGKTAQLAAAGARVTAVERDGEARSAAAGEPVAAAALGGGGGGGRDRLERRRRRALRRGAAGRALHRDRHHPPPSGRALSQAGARRGAARGGAGGADGSGGAAAPAGRAAGLRHLLAPGGGRGGALGDGGGARSACRTRCGPRRCRGWKRR